jgi:hypothetical protein
VASQTIASIVLFQLKVTWIHWFDLVAPTWSLPSDPLDQLNQSILPIWPSKFKDLTLNKNILLWNFFSDWTAERVYRKKGDVSRCYLYGPRSCSFWRTALSISGSRIGGQHCQNYLSRSNGKLWLNHLVDFKLYFSVHTSKGPRWRIY